MRAITDGTQPTPQVVQTYLTDAYGLRSETPPGSVIQPFEYAGEQRDGEAALYYLRARMYDSHLGGASQPDFVGRGVLNWMRFEITTPGQVVRHLRRPYGMDLQISTYEPPPGFVVFP